MSERILLVAPFPPEAEPRHGGGRALHGLVRALSERNEVVLLHLGGERPADPAVVAGCAAVHAVAAPALGPWATRLRGAAALARGRTLWDADPALRDLARRTRDLGDALRPSVVQVEHGHLGRVLAGRPSGSLRVLTVHEPAAATREHAGRRAGRVPFAHALDAAAAARRERHVLAAADAAVVFTERDRRLVAASAPPGTEVAVIPLGAEIPPDPLDPAGAEPPTLLFVGSFRHPPNAEAAVRLARHVFPPLRAARPELRLQLVGERPPPEVRALGAPGTGVEVTGAVPSVRPHLDRAAVVVAPLATGGGMRVKVIEALAAGKAVVTTPRGAEGLPGDVLAVAADDEALRQAIAALLADPGARRRLAARARAWAERELPWDVTAGRYAELYERLRRR